MAKAPAAKKGNLGRRVGKGLMGGNRKSANKKVAESSKGPKEKSGTSKTTNKPDSARKAAKKAARKTPSKTQRKKAVERLASKTTVKNAKKKASSRKTTKASTTKTVKAPRATKKNLGKRTGRGRFGGNP